MGEVGPEEEVAEDEDGEDGERDEAAAEERVEGWICEEILGLDGELVSCWCVCLDLEGGRGREMVVGAYVDSLERVEEGGRDYGFQV